MAHDRGHGGGAGSVLRSAGTVAVGAGVGQLLVLASSPVLTRLYDPVAFGVFGVVTSLESVLVVAAAGRYEQAVQLPEDDRDGVNLLALCLLVLVGSVALAAVVILVLGAQVAAWLDIEGWQAALALLPILLLVDGVFLSLSAWTVRRRRFRRLAGARTSLGGAQVVGQVGLGISAAAPASLLAGVAIGRLGAVGVLAGSFLRRDRALLGGVSFEAMRRLARRYRRFPLVQGWSATVNAAGQQLPAILLASLFDPTVAGWYLLGNRVVVAPAALLGTATAQTFLGRAAVLRRERPGEVGAEAWGVVRRLALAGLVPTAVLVVAAPTIFSVVFGSQWEEAGRYVQVLAPAFLVQWAVGPVTPMLSALELHGRHAAWNLARLGTVVAALVLPAAAGWTPLATLATFSVVTVAAYLVLGAVLVGAARGAATAALPSQGRGR